MIIDAIITTILVFLIIFIFIYEPPSLLKKRFNKAAAQRENAIAKFMLNLQNALRPLSQKNIQSGDFISKSKKMLLQAGYASTEEDVIKYDTQRLANVILFGFGGILLFLVLMEPAYAILADIILVTLVYKFPESKLKREIKKRQKEFMRYLPDAVDLLAICVQAGLGLDSAFEKVSEEFTLTSETVSVEFGRLNKDILSGLNREDAYKNLILRNENPDLQSFVALLIQSDRLGTSITQSLSAFCDTLRTRKRQRIEELSQQASTKMTIPMVLCMLPAIFIIILFPAIQKIMLNLPH